MIKEETLNKVKVKPLVVSNQDFSAIKGNELFPSLYYNLFICSKKKSGKTSLINTIIQKCTDKRTIFFIFCPTVNVDASWKAIVEYLEKRGNAVNTYTELMDGKVNILNEIVNELSMGQEEPEKEEKKEEVVGKKIKFDDPAAKKKREYKPKKISPEVVFIFDDASEMLKNPALSTLLKKNRHLKSNVIISSQYLHDLAPMSIKQLDYFVCFKSFSEDKLQLVHKGLDLSIEFDKLWNLYQHCTSKPYSFLYINVRNEEFRCNFNKKLEIDY
jgi:hypothetical protein